MDAHDIRRGDRLKNALVISEDLSLPLDLGTQTTAILGIRGSGKTNTGTVFAEELLGRNHQVVVIDPLDASWGLRSGFPIYVFGGEHGDLPLLPTSGNVVADFVVDSRASVILSLRHFKTKADERKFVTEFCERLFQRKGATEFRQPVLVIIDEASSFVPQRVMGEQARMVGAVQDLVRKGRTSGIGVVLIDQRAASVNKDVLTQTEMMVIHRITSPQDRKAIEAWIEVHDAEGRAETVLSTLHKLPKGDAWIWSPSWLELLERVHVRHRKTFDSSATPKAGEVIAPPKKLAKVDLEALRVQMTETVEKAKAEDPRELRKEIALLKKELAAKKPAPDVVEKIVTEKPIIREADLARLEKIGERFEEQGAKLKEMGAIFVSLAQTERVFRAKQAAAPSPVKASFPPHPVRPTTVARFKQPTTQAGEMTPTARVVLSTIGQFPSGATRQRIAVMSGRSIKSSSFQSAFPALEAQGLIQKIGEKYSVTAAGAEIAGSEPLPTGPELLRHWLGKLSPSEAKVLQAIVDAHPKAVTREEVAESTGQSSKSSSFQSAFPALRDLELVEGRSEFTASEAFFE